MQRATVEYRNVDTTSEDGSTPFEYYQVELIGATGVGMALSTPLLRGVAGVFGESAQGGYTNHTGTIDVVLESLAANASQHRAVITEMLGDPARDVQAAFVVHTIHKKGSSPPYPITITARARATTTTATALATTASPTVTAAATSTSTVPAGLALTTTMATATATSSTVTTTSTTSRFDGRFQLAANGPPDVIFVDHAHDCSTQVTALNALLAACPAEVGGEIKCDSQTLPYPLNTSIHDPTGNCATTAAALAAAIRAYSGVPIEIGCSFNGA